MRQAGLPQTFHFFIMTMLGYLRKLVQLKSEHYISIVKTHPVRRIFLNIRGEVIELGAVTDFLTHLVDDLCVVRLIKYC